MKLSELKSKLKQQLETQFNERETKQLLAIIFEKVLKLNRAQQTLSSNQEIEESAINKLQEFTKKLINHVPIDYLVNETSFYGREFYVDERVLIPRSETEELVLWVLESEDTNGLTLLDIGSGSGCIPISLYLEGKFLQVDACEISETANEVAEINANLLKASVSFNQLDILTQVPHKQYDIVVSNPPYVKQEELQGLDKNVIEHEPIIALAPEGDSLTFYKRMIAIAPEMLKVGGRLYWEIHEDLGKEVVDLLEKGGCFEKVELKQDLFGRDRLVRAVLMHHSKEIY